MTALRIRDLALPLTEHKRSMVDGTVDESATDELQHRAERTKPRPFLVQCRFVTPVRGVSALAVKATDRTPMLEIKELVLESLHALPEPQRPSDAILASCGSRYFQRQSLRNDFKVSISTDPEQLLFFLDEDDECLADSVTFFELGYESPPLVSVYCATDHLWLRIRGFPERFSVPWHLHMSECELAKEVYGVLKPNDMRMVRAVFYRDEEAIRRTRKWRRPATQAPPAWKPGSVFGALETEESFDENYLRQRYSSSSSSSQHQRHPHSAQHGSKNTNTQQQQQHHRHQSNLPTCVVVPLHEWCRIPPPPDTKMDPACIFQDLRKETAQIRCDMIREAFIQARDSWFEIPTDLEKYADPEYSLEFVPRFIQLLRTRDGREYVFRVELTSAKAGVIYLETGEPLGEFAEAVLAHCESTQPEHKNRKGGGGGGGGEQHSNSNSPAASRRNSPSQNRSDDGDGDDTNNEDGDDYHHRHRGPSQDSVASSGGESSTTTTTVKKTAASLASSFQVELLSWEPQLVATGIVLENGEEEKVPHSHPQLSLPFDDDDEEISPFGRKELHGLWSSTDMMKRYPFLETDFFFHKRRVNASVPEMEDHLRAEVKKFLQEPLRFTVNPPNISSKEDTTSTVEFDMESLPRHLSDYGISNGSEVFVEFFSAHTQQWSNDVAQTIHDRMKEHVHAVNAHQALMSRKTMRRHQQQQHEHLPTNMFSHIQQNSNSDNDDGGGALMMGGNKKNRSGNGNAASSAESGRRGSFHLFEQRQRQDTSFSELPVSEQQVGRSGRRRNQLQISKRQREVAVRAAGFNFVNVRTSRGVLLRVPVVYDVATVQDIFDLVFCATGDVQMFSVMVGPQGELIPPWTHLCEVERNPGLLSLRILRRPRPWFNETIETVAKAAHRREPHLD